jgi:WD40 repeat protein
MVRLWDTATWTVRAEFRAHRDRVTAVAFGPDGRLFTGGLDTIVIGWDVQPPQATAINVMQERDKPTSKDLATTRPPGGVPLVPAGQGQGAIGATKE